jgi:hypothetical protein
MNKNKHAKIISTIILSIIILSIPFVYANMDELKSALNSKGFSGVIVEETDQGLFIEYDKSVKEFKNINEEFKEISQISILTYQKLDETQIILKQKFDDGEVMQVKVQYDKSYAYSSGEINLESFMDSLQMVPLTRGKPIVEIECNSQNTCLNEPDCACLDSQNCEPKNSNSNSWGCVDINNIENSEIRDKNIVCKNGFVWDNDQSNCISINSLDCNDETIYFNGECVTANAENNNDSDDSGALVAIGIFGLIIFSIIGLVFIGVIVLIIFLIRKSKRK